MTKSERMKRYRSGLALSSGEKQLVAEQRRNERVAEADWSWRDDAACKDKPTDWWFGSDRVASEETQWAIAICEGCPVRAACLDFAINTHQEEGLWAGLNPRERRNERRRRQRAAQRRTA